MMPKFLNKYRFELSVGEDWSKSLMRYVSLEFDSRLDPKIEWVDIVNQMVFYIYALDKYLCRMLISLSLLICFYRKEPSYGDGSKQPREK